MKAKLRLLLGVVLMSGMTMVAAQSKSPGSLPFGTSMSTTTSGVGTPVTTQTSQIEKPIGKSGVYVHGGSTTTVTGGSTMGGSGQPIPNNTSGSRSTTTYGGGVGVRF